MIRLRYEQDSALILNLTNEKSCIFGAKKQKSELPLCMSRRQWDSSVVSRSLTDRSTGILRWAGAGYHSLALLSAVLQSEGSAHGLIDLPVDLTCKILDFWKLWLFYLDTKKLHITRIYILWLSYRTTYQSVIFRFSWHREHFQTLICFVLKYELTGALYL